jgi:DNA-binding CsgD family transcriptional regulator/PAS domain-containing protein
MALASCAMREAEQLSSLIGDIYDAALDPSLWIGVLAKCAQFVGGPAAVLFSRDTTRKSCNAAYYCGIDPHYKRLITDRYIRADPVMMGQVFARIGEPVAITDITPRDELLQAHNYQEWGRPQGLGDALGVALDKSATSAALLMVFRHERDGQVDGEMRLRMRLIFPHIRRSLLVGRVVHLRTAEAATFADTFDGISAGMFLVDARGRIVHANASGQALLDQGFLLRTTGGKLTAGDARAEQALHEVFLAASSGDAAVGTKGIDVPLIACEGERYVAHVLPLTSGARRRAGTSYAAVAALFVHKTALGAPSAPQAIAETYKLTPGELRVLLGIVQAGSVPETAAALGIGNATVRTHLLKLYAKTGTRHQSELVKLVAGFSNPLVG